MAGKDIILVFEKILPHEVRFSLKDELSISEDIDTEVDEASFKFGYYAVISEKADTRLQKLKFGYEKWVSGIKRNEQRRRELVGVKSLTKDQMDAFVNSQPKYISYQKALIEYGDHSRILKAVSKAFDMRSGLVQTKAANRRRETYKGS